MSAVSSASEVRYARSGDAQLAYREAGHGPTLVCLTGTMPGLMFWENERTRRFYDRLAGFSQVLAYDARGCGRSDPILSGQPRSVEDRVADVLALMDTAGMRDAFVFAAHDGGAVGIVLAAAHPDRVRGLFLYNTWARLLKATDHPWGLSQESSDALIEAHDQSFGTGFLIDYLFPSVAQDPLARAWWAELEQRGASRAQAVLLTTQAQELDVRAVLPTVRVPTTVAHAEANLSIPVNNGRYLAEHIPGARFVALPGVDQLWFLEPEPLLEEIEEFVTGTRHAPPTDRVLATVLFTDIVDSTTRLAVLGDRRWRDILDRHDDIIAQAIERYRGRKVNPTGDGILAVFDGPARAVQCACTIRDRVAQLGIAVRAGIHTGEIELRGDDIAGIAVHVGARVAVLANDGEVLVTRTVTDLVVGSGLRFVEHGEHELKGVPGHWQVFAVVPTD